VKEEGIRKVEGFGNVGETADDNVKGGNVV
jgi:hypothetical protein